MRTKRTLSKALIIALGFSLIPVSALAATKVSAGAACKSLKQQVVYQNKTFTCVKSGKKVVWDKGRVIPRPAPLNPIVTAASDNFKKYSSSIRNTQQVKVVAQPGVDQQLIKWVKEGANFVAQRFDYPTLSRGFVNFIAIDKVWLESSYLAEGFSTSYSKFRSDDFCSGNPACGGKDSNVWNFTSIKNENLLIRDKAGMAQTPAHEFFHAIQENLAPGLVDSTGTNVPQWFWEGSATFIGLQTAGVLGFIDYNTLGRDSMVERYKFGNSINRTSNLSEIKANDGVTDPYAIGFAATELLVSKVGVEKLVKIFAELGTGKTFEIAFETATGISLLEFYSLFESVRGSLGFPKGL